MAENEPLTRPPRRIRHSLRHHPQIHPVNGGVQMVSQPGFFDLDDRYVALSKAGDPLEFFNCVILPHDATTRVLMWRSDESFLPLA